MWTRALVFLCGQSPALRRALWRWWYNKLARRIGHSGWTFMNYGFQPSGPTPPLPLLPEDEPDRFCVQLYERVTASVDLTGAHVVEVGSGRGGGASYLARRRGPATVLGLDYSSEAVAFCATRHAAVRNLRFQRGDAENLPLESGVANAVVNVESSHCYGDVPRFFNEASRILAPDGRFLFADLRDPAEMVALREQLQAASGLEIIEEEDITAGVSAALEADDARKRGLIDTIVPPPLRPLFSEFAGLSGTPISRNLKARSLVYHRFVARRA